MTRLALIAALLLVAAILKVRKDARVWAEVDDIDWLSEFQRLASDPTIPMSPNQRRRAFGWPPNPMAEWDSFFANQGRPS